MATWTLFQPFDLLAAELFGGGDDVVVEAATPTFYRDRDPVSGLVSELYGSGLAYGDDGEPVGGVLDRAGLYDAGGALLLRIDGAFWDIAAINAAADPPSGEPDIEALAELMFGGNDSFFGSTGDDLLFGIGGDDLVDGDGGLDTVVFLGARAGFEIARAGAGWTVTDAGGNEGQDTLREVERLAFPDGAVALDLDGAAGTVARLIGAVFGPSYVADPAIAGIGLALLDGGLGAAELAALAVDSDLFAELAGSRSDADFVDLVFANVVGRVPDEAERDEFVALLEDGTFTQASLALFAAESELTALRIDLAGLAETGLDYEPFLG